MRGTFPVKPSSIFIAMRSSTTSESELWSECLFVVGGDGGGVEDAKMKKFRWGGFFARNSSDSRP